MRGTLGLVLVVGLVGQARAESPEQGPAPPGRAATPEALRSTFDAAAAKAARLDSFADLVWTFTATCESGDDLAKRQCRTVRDAAAARLRGVTIWVDAPASAFAAGAYDAAKKAVPLVVRGCLECDGIEVDGARWFVVASKTAPKVAGEKVTAGDLFQAAKPFDAEVAAAGWGATIGSRARTQLLVKVPDKKLTWKDGAVRGLYVDVIGYRVIDACDGSIVAAQPESRPVEPNQAACGAQTATPAEGKKRAAEKLPDELTKDQILATLRPATDDARACFDQFGVSGDARLKLTIGGDGSVIGLEQTGDFTGTPTGDCITAAIKTAKFPRSRRAKLTFVYPIQLR